MKTLMSDVKPFSARRTGSSEALSPLRMTPIAVWLLFLSFGAARGGTNDAILSEVSVLTIHVSDTNTHDTVFHFLTDVLRLPIDYGPETLGERRYAAVFAGNTFIEPCGPFSDMAYPVKDFRALFFGLNCSADKPPSAIAAGLRRLRLAYEQVSPDTFRIQEPSLAQGLYLAISSGSPRKAVKEKDLRLSSAMAANHRDGLGLEYVKEIRLGYTEPGDLKAWSEFLGKSGRQEDRLWRLDNHQTIRLVKSDLRGVKAIVFKVRSVQNAERYLRRTKCFGRWVDGKIELDMAKTCGLSIYFAGD